LVGATRIEKEPADPQDESAKHNTLDGIRSEIISFFILTYQFFY